MQINWLDRVNGMPVLARWSSADADLTSNKGMRLSVAQLCRRDCNAKKMRPHWPTDTPHDCQSIRLRHQLTFSTPAIGTVACARETKAQLRWQLKSNKGRRAWEDNVTSAASKGKHRKANQSITFSVHKQTIMIGAAHIGYLGQIHCTTFIWAIHLWTRSSKCLSKRIVRNLSSLIQKFNLGLVKRSIVRMSPHYLRFQ